jgi:hypothetical protein
LDAPSEEGRFGVGQSDAKRLRTNLLPLLLLYLFLLGALAAFTAYTRNFQRTLVELGSRIGEPASAGSCLTASAF